MRTHMLMHNPNWSLADLNAPCTHVWAAADADLAARGVASVAFAIEARRWEESAGAETPVSGLTCTSDAVEAVVHTRSMDFAW